MSADEKRDVALQGMAAVVAELNARTNKALQVATATNISINNVVANQQRLQEQVNIVQGAATSGMGEIQNSLVGAQANLVDTIARFSDVATQLNKGAQAQADQTTMLTEMQSRMANVETTLSQISEEGKKQTEDVIAFKALDTALGETLDKNIENTKKIEAIAENTKKLAEDTNSKVTGALSSKWITFLIVLGAVLVVGGVLYFMIKQE